MCIDGNSWWYRAYGLFIQFLFFLKFCKTLQMRLVFDILHTGKSNKCYTPLAFTQKHSASKFVIFWFRWFYDLEDWVFRCILASLYKGLVIHSLGHHSVRSSVHWCIRPTKRMPVRWSMLPICNTFMKKQWTNRPTNGPNKECLDPLLEMRVCI